MASPAGTTRRRFSGRSSGRSWQRRDRQKVAVLLHDAGSLNKVAQTLLEMVRGGIAELPVDVTAFYEGDAARAGVRGVAAAARAKPCIRATR